MESIISSGKEHTNEVEETTFEKFERNVKNTTFGVLFVLLKDDDSSLAGFIIGAILDSFQMYQFLFANQVTWPWNMPSITKYIVIGANVLEVATWLGYTKKWLAYIIVYYIFIFLVILVILDIIYVAYSFTKRKFAYMWPLKLLRSVCGLIVTVLFMPLLELFFSIFLCEKEDGNMVHALFKEQRCFSGIHILHVSIGAFISFLFVIICLIVVYTFFETKSTSKDPAARTDSKTDILIILFKLVLTLLFNFFQDNKYRWMLLIVMCGGATTIFYMVSHYRPYYNETVSDFMNCLHGGYMYSCYVLLIAMVLDNYQFNGSLELLILGYPPFIALILVFGDRREILLLKSVNEFDNGIEYRLKLRYLLALIGSKETNSKSDAVLKGYLVKHKELCDNIDCPISLYFQALNSYNNTNAGKSKQTQPFENNGLLITFTNKEFMNGISKFPTCSTLRIAYAFFLIEHLNNKNLAINELNLASNCHPKFDEEFIIYRYKKIIEEEMTEGHNESGNLDVVSIIAYDNHFLQCQESIKKSALYHFEFWTILTESMPDFGKLDKMGSKINSSIASIEEHWECLQKINPNVPKSLKMYAQFLIEILNDKEGGNELLSRAKESSNTKDMQLDGNLSSDGAACVTASGVPNKLGKIISVNSSTTRIFGYNKMELENRSINILIPDMIDKYHDEMLLKFINRGGELSHSERILMGAHKTGHVMPLLAHIRIMPSFSDGLQFVGMFRMEKRPILLGNVAYLMVNNAKLIMHSTSSTIKMFGIDHKYLTKTNININDIIPNIFSDQNKNSLLSKDGSQVEVLIGKLQNICYTSNCNLNPPQEAERQSSNSASAKQLKKNHTKVLEPPNNDEKLASEKVPYKCNIGTITLKDVGIVGHLIRLEELAKAPTPKNKKTVRFPEFQFLYNFEQKSFYRAMVNKQNCKEPTEKDESEFVESQISYSESAPKNKIDTSTTKQKDSNTSKNDLKVADPQTQPISEESKSESYESYYENEEGKEDECSVEEDIEEDNSNEQADQSLEDVVVNSEENNTKAIHKLRKDFSNSIGTKRINDKGEAVDIQNLGNEEKKNEDVTENVKDENKEKQNKELDILKSSIKSRKVLNTSIRQKIVPPPIAKLKKIGISVLLLLISLSVIEYAVQYNTTAEIEKSITLVDYGYKRVTLNMKLGFNILQLIHLAHTSPNDFNKDNTIINNTLTAINDDLEEYYSIQNWISLNKVTLSKEHQTLYNTKSVTLYYGPEKTKNYYTLTEAVLQITSSIFTIYNLNLNPTTYNTQQEDINFFIYNAFSDLNDDLLESSHLYNNELNIYSKNRKKILLIFLIVSIIFLVISVSTCLPIVSGIGKIRKEILHMFLSIPIPTIKMLSKKCDEYVAKGLDDKKEGDSQCNDSFSQDDTLLLNTLANQTKSNARKFSNFTTSNAPFYFKFIFGALILETYFAVNYGFTLQFLSKTSSYNSEINAISMLTSSYAYSLSAFE